MKKFYSRIALALVLLLALATMAMAEPAPDGVYHGSSFGRNGNIDVDVTIEGGAIADVTVTSHTETDNIGTVAVAQMPQKIVEARSIAVDGLSGATFTSNGILRAVENALTDAGIDAEAFKVAQDKVTGASYEVEADVVVIGGGGAGLAAAVSALQSGAQRVVVVEKTDILGGDTNVNGGIYNTPDAELQDQVEMTDGQKSLIEAAIAQEPVSEEHAALIEAVKADWDAYLQSGNTGIFDSANWFALQTWNGGDKVAKLDLVKNLADNAYAGLDWLKSLGQEFKPTISQGPGSLFPRTHDTPSGIGAEFINTYIKYLGENYVDQVQYYMGVTAEELELTDGVCNTVKGTDKDGNTYTFTAKGGVVLATGGFAGNVEMRVEYCQSEKWPDLGVNVGCTGVASDTGDGILMARAIGANLVDMDQIQLLHTCSPKYGTTEDNSDKGKSVDSIIFVNKAGERFVAEDERRDTICLAVLQQEDALFYTLESYDGYGDKTLDELHSNNFVSYTDEIARGNMFIGDTIEDLAEAMGADPEKLRASIEGYNASVDAGASTDEFGRKTFINKLENGPFIAVPRKPSAHHTMGGVEINVNTEVLDTEGNAIPGLYAAGEVTGGIHGGNRLGGNAIVDTVVNGKMAGQQAAELAK